MSDFGFYSANEFLSKKFEERDFLIDRILHKKDSVLLAGKPKTGKSVLLFNLICSLTSGDPFLDQFDVKKKCRVLYIQLEGSLDDSQDRMNRMIKAMSFERDNFFIMFSQPLRLQIQSEMLKLIRDIREKMQTVDVIIIDPIYFAMVGGSLSDDTSVRDFTGNLRIMQEAFDAACVLSHHFKKARRDQKGRILPPDDDDVFGSVFFQAWITHQFLFDVDQTTQARILQCNVQRSGKIIDRLSLKMIQPDPLYYEQYEEHPAKADEISKFLKANQGTAYKAKDIYEAINMPKSSFYRFIKPLISGGSAIRISRDNEYHYTAS